MTGPAGVAGLGAVLLAIGVYGALTRRHLLGALIGIQVALLAGGVTLAGLSRLASRPPQVLAGDALAATAAILAGAQALLGAALALLGLRHLGEDRLDAEDG